MPEHVLGGWTLKKYRSSHDEPLGGGGKHLIFKLYNY